MALVNATRLTSIIDVEALTSSKPSAPILPGRPPRSRRRASEREGSHVYQRSSTPADVGRGSGGWSGGRRGLGGGPAVRCCTIAGRGAGRVGRWLPGAAMAGATPPIAVRRRRLSGPGPGRRGRAGSARGIGRLSRNLGADLRCCRQYRRLRPFSELPLRARRRQPWGIAGRSCPAAETLRMRQGPAFGDGSSAPQKNLQFTPFGSTPARTGASCQDAWHPCDASRDMMVGTLSPTAS